MSQALREVSNLTNYLGDPKSRGRTTGSAAAAGVVPTTAASFTFQSQDSLTVRSRRSRSPRADTRHADTPVYCTDLIKDITESYLDCERKAVRTFNESTALFNSAAASGSPSALSRAPTPSDIYSYYPSPHYLQYQPEVNEKMRMILVDWLVDVHLKFKLHPETFFLCVNLIDRYLSVHNTKYRSDANAFVPRAQLQLVGVCCMLLASKYEEIWPPEIKECVHISANTYSREEIITTERAICGALSFRLTVPTAFPFASRLWTVLEGEAARVAITGSTVLPMDTDDATLHTLLKHATSFFLEHSLLDYKSLQFTPSQVANAAVYLALATLRLQWSPAASTALWTDLLQHYSSSPFQDFKGCAEVMLEHVHHVPTTKYQAVRRKYNSSKYGEISKLSLPNQVPIY